MKTETVIEALRELVRQIGLCNAVDDHGHELKNLQALADARAILRNVPQKPPKPWKDDQGKTLKEIQETVL